MHNTSEMNPLKFSRFLHIFICIRSKDTYLKSVINTVKV